MFNRYWRSYPWFLQLFLFAMMVFTFLSLSSYILIAFLPKLSGGIAYKELNNLGPSSPPALARAALIVQGIGHFSIYTLPCLLFAYLTHPRPGKYLGLKAPGNALHWLLVPGAMIGFMFFSVYLESLIMTHIKIPEYMQKMQEKSNAQTAGMMNMKTFSDLIKTVLVMALLPAFGEELLFRGILMRFAHKRSHSMIFPIIVSAVLFMLVHSNPLGMPFILMAGVILALIYWLTGSIWCSILAHFLYNGLQIVFAYISKNAAGSKVAEAMEHLPAYVPFLGLLLFIACGYLLVKTKTPLPANWSDDFSEPAGAAIPNSSHTY